MSEERMKVGVLVSGGGTDLQSIIDAGINVVKVISSKEGVYALERAEKAGIEAMAVTKKQYPKIADRMNVINIHPALLPKFGGPGFYGLNVHKAVLAAKETESGATVHFVNEGVDKGPIIAQSRVPVMEDDTPETLQARVLEVEHVLLPQTILELEKQRREERKMK